MNVFPVLVAFFAVLLHPIPAKPVINDPFPDYGIVKPTVERVNLTLPTTPIVHTTEIIKLLNPKTGVALSPVDTTVHPISSTDPPSDLSSPVLATVVLTSSEVISSEFISPKVMTTTTDTTIVQTILTRREQEIENKLLNGFLLVLAVVMCFALYAILRNRNVNFLIENIQVRREFKRLSQNRSQESSCFDQQEALRR